MKEEYFNLMKHCGFTKLREDSDDLTDIFYNCTDSKGTHHCITFIGNTMDTDIFAYNNDDQPYSVAETLFGIDELINFLCKIFPTELRKFKIERIIND